MRARAAVVHIDKVIARITTRYPCFPDHWRKLGEKMSTRHQQQLQQKQQEQNHSKIDDMNGVKFESEKVLHKFHLEFGVFRR